MWGVADLAVRYGGHTALSGVHLDVPAGAVTAVVGGDGAGKTSLLRVLAGALAPSAGSVRRPPQERIGYVSAGPGVPRDLTVAEHLAFVADAYRLDGAARARIPGLLARTGLAGARDRLAGHLSGGMRQKLALAAALLPVPALLVLDEPTTGVDPVSRADLWRLMGRAAADGAAVVLATTYLDEAERAASLLVLDAGRPLRAGTPAAVIAAMPGAVLDAAVPGPAARSWRRGSRWRVWLPEGAAPGAQPAAADLEDALIVARLAQETL